MHELALAQDMIELALKEGERHSAKKILSMNVKYGAMTMMEPDCFRFYFDEFSKGTIAEGAVLNFEKVDIMVECKSCGKTSKVEDLLMICSFCQSISLNLISGDEIFLEDIEVDI